MVECIEFAVVDLKELVWPAAIALPSPRLRLFVAADTGALEVNVISEFGMVALKKGMVYLCAWGNGCERFHDIVDEVIAYDDITERRFAGSNERDTVMTTWHDDERLEAALEFFTMCANPTDGYMEQSEFWLVITVRRPEWAVSARKFLEQAMPV